MKVKDVLLIFIYVLLGVLTRTIWHIAPNVEFVTALSIASAFFLRKKYSFFVPIIIMVVSDLIIGNTPIFLFTWSAFALAHILGKSLHLNVADRLLGKIAREVKILVVSECGGIIFSLFFYLWTNFGVVVVSNMYPKNIEGLFLSYKMGLPFLWPQLIGNMIIVPAVFLLTDIAYKRKFNILKGVREKV
ncbi:hypothetical protein JW766_06745 [Candidatus Dojkabacteria bacterium]|nr:hypothetical protein [Candidatus Dojkabacteria bacterium]